MGVELLLFQHNLGKIVGALLLWCNLYMGEYGTRVQVCVRCSPISACGENCTNTSQILLFFLCSTVEK